MIKIKILREIAMPKNTKLRIYMDKTYEVKKVGQEILCHDSYLDRVLDFKNYIEVLDTNVKDKSAPVIKEDKDEPSTKQK